MKRASTECAAAVGDRDRCDAIRAAARLGAGAERTADHRQQCGKAEILVMATHSFYYGKRASETTSAGLDHLPRRAFRIRHARVNPRVGPLGDQIRSASN